MPDRSPPGTSRSGARDLGDAARAEKLAAETARVFPNGTIWNAVQLPEIRAAIALHHGQPAQSLELLASAAAYERAYLDASYLRRLAYLRRNRVRRPRSFTKSSITGAPVGALPGSTPIAYSSIPSPISASRAPPFSPATHSKPKKGSKF